MNFYLSQEAQDFIDACEVRHDAHEAWLDAMNGPLPPVKVERFYVPRVACDSRRPAPKDIPAEWRIA